MTTDAPAVHWDPLREPRARGLGSNLQHISCKTYHVSSLRGSIEFYRRILRFKILEQDETSASATLDCKNMVITIKSKEHQSPFLVISFLVTFVFILAR